MCPHSNEHENPYLNKYIYIYKSPSWHQKFCYQKWKICSSWALPVCVHLWTPVEPCPGATESIWCRSERCVDIAAKQETLWGNERRNYAKQFPMQFPGNVWWLDTIEYNFRSIPFCRPQLFLLPYYQTFYTSFTIISYLCIHPSIHPSVQPSKHTFTVMHPSNSMAVENQLIISLINMN